MKKVGIILFGLVLLTIVEVTQSCCNCDDYVNEEAYSLCEIEAKNLDNSGSTILSSNGPISKEAYALRIVCKYNLGLCQNHQNNRFLVSSAYAFSCGCWDSPIYIPTDSITNISILANKDFDISLPAQSDISDLFRSYHDGEYLSVHDESRRLFASREYLTVPLDSMDILLMQAPTDTGTYHFEIIFEFKSGKQIIAQTSDIRLI